VALIAWPGSSIVARARLPTTNATDGSSQAAASHPNPRRNGVANAISATVLTSTAAARSSSRRSFETGAASASS